MDYNMDQSKQCISDAIIITEIGFNICFFILNSVMALKKKTTVVIYLLFKQDETSWPHWITQ